MNHSTSFWDSAFFGNGRALSSSVRRLINVCLVAICGSVVVVPVALPTEVIEVEVAEEECVFVESRDHRHDGGGSIPHGIHAQSARACSLRATGVPSALVGRCLEFNGTGYPLRR